MMRRQHRRDRAAAATAAATDVETRAETGVETASGVAAGVVRIGRGEPPLEQPRLPLTLRIIGLVLYGLAGALTALYEVLIVPLRVGTVLIPVAVVLAVGTNIVLPWLSHQLTRSVPGALPPVIAWIVSVGALSSTRPEGDVLLPGGGGVQFVSYGVLLGGLLAGLLTVALLAGSASSGERARARRAALAEDGRSSLRS